MRWQLAASLVVISAVVLADPATVVTTAEVPLSEVARQWGLSEADYRRYQAIMAGQRGQWTPGLDPITALGVSTDSAEERKRFAELFVATEFERTHKELAFQRAVDAAWQRLYPDTPRLHLAAQATQQSSRYQRMALILRRNGKAGHERLQTLLTNPSVPVDVHVVGTQGSDRALRAWAASFPSLITALNAGQATLNHGNQFRAELDLPAIYRKNGAGQWTRVE
ncbi:TIGR03759 family integrating conjugative element protein [Haliea salexigens]|jgi:integrating conjugative element protein (TIGR03759 family)|uniref:TIGR03759 family integrating conjugative element protein n=1 Tax=Haliea salexigens TaxID=287487 RepID=UPI000418471F|nr:TIGR03759 family integrating conjugative element protein [Haliea salexigens]|tara:strand:- start:237 stop:908 length:672 start_codon:yes stop_codon:yes gene_type:complete